MDICWFNQDEARIVQFRTKETAVEAFKHFLDRPAFAKSFRVAYCPRPSTPEKDLVVYVGDMQEGQFRTIIRPYAPQIVLMTFRPPGTKGASYIHVQFTTTEAAAAALEYASPLEVGGRKIYIQYASDFSDIPRPNTLSIYARNMTRSKIRAVFRPHASTILQFKVPPREHDYGAFAQITFENADQAAAVVEAYGGRMYMGHDFPLSAKETTSKLLLKRMEVIHIQFKTTEQAVNALNYVSASHQKLRNKLGYGSLPYQVPTKQLNAYVGERTLDEVRNTPGPQQSGLQGIRLSPPLDGEYGGVAVIYYRDTEVAKTTIFALEVKSVLEVQKFMNFE
ncbi:hypothetical protein AAF712_010375 [Marasmius tenuissimus]|uniref:RRM domain-containing protein n=1 Tax=Marasmius tenuissimus TaxID=585030 RepID=A0ABR2ZMX1_9AGAR